MSNVLSYSLSLSLSLKRERGWRTFKRPGVDAFMEHMARYYEVVVYSDQQPMVSCF
jgi:TFIIF-interacting CTD phosphatase-like protein